MYVNSNRVNHFKEWLDYLFEDHGEIDKLLIDKIAKQPNITKEQIKIYLKNHGLSKMYCQITKIYNTIHSIEQPVLSPEIKQKLKEYHEGKEIRFNDPRCHCKTIFYP